MSFNLSDFIYENKTEVESCKCKILFPSFGQLDFADATNFLAHIRRFKKEVHVRKKNSVGGKKEKT